MPRRPLPASSTRLIPPKPGPHSAAPSRPTPAAREAYGDTPRRHILGLRVVSDGRPHASRAPWRLSVDFPVPEIPIPHTTKHTGGYRLESRDGLDIDLFAELGRNARPCSDRSRALRLLPSPAEFLAGGGLLFQMTIAPSASSSKSWRGEAQARMLDYFDRYSARSAADPLRRDPARPSARRFCSRTRRPTSMRWHIAAGRSRRAPRRFLVRFTPGDREKFRRFRHARARSCRTPKCAAEAS